MICVSTCGGKMDFKFKAILGVDATLRLTLCPDKLKKYYCSKRLDSIPFLG